MIKIVHRVNSIHKLQKTPSSFGIEVDVRQWGRKIIVEHDAFQPGVRFEKWLEHVNHKLVVLNIKSEGIEELVVAKFLEKQPLTDYFLLDQSFPFLVKALKSRKFVSAARVSDLEEFPPLIDFSPEWLWIDCHNGDWSFLRQTLPLAHNLKVRTCLVSPELHNRNVEVEMQQIQSIIRELNLEPTSVCTKNPEQW